VRWTLLTERLIDPLIRFIAPNEGSCVAFTEKLISDGSVGVPSASDAVVHCRLDQKGRVTAAIMQSRGGVFYPVLSDEPDPSIGDEALRLIRRHGRRIYSVMGKDRDVDALVAAFRRPPSQIIEYHHMIQQEPPRDFPLPRLPEHMTIHTASVADAEALFDIQRQYEIEEVLLPGSEFNRSASLRHLRETLATQIVLYGELDGKAIAKAGTNARGLFFDQIGGVFTEPGLRSRGIGTRLMTKLLGLIAAQSKSASLFVKGENAPAIRLYRNLGFGIQGGFRIVYYR
jgi:predicted GNAT family acetyltransferase